jgi:hypothetical protein
MLPMGALAQFQVLGLAGNKISDAGVTAFAQAMLRVRRMAFILPSLIRFRSLR